MNPQHMQLWGEISALLLKSLHPWGSAVVSAPPLHVGNLWTSAPWAREGSGWLRSLPKWQLGH